MATEQSKIVSMIATFKNNIFSFSLFNLILLVLCLPKTVFASGSELIINEIYPLPVGSEAEWIELFNTTSDKLFLDHYSIEDNNGETHRKTLSGLSVEPQGFIILDSILKDFSFGLNNTGDTVVLKKDSVVIDQLSFGNYDDGNKFDNAPSPSDGQSIFRQIGKNTGINAIDFSISKPTPKEPNYLKSYSNSISISEVLAAPSDSSENEFIELFNSGQEPVDLSGWQIDDKEGGSKNYQIPIGTHINGGQNIAFYKVATHLSLNDAGDSIRLFDPGGGLKNQVFYDKAVQGKSYCNHLSWQICESTPNSQNVNIILEEQNSVVQKKPQEISMIGNITAAPGDISDYYGYFQNEEISLQFYSSKKEFPVLTPGDLINVTGRVSTANGERRLLIDNINNIIILGHNTIPVPKELIDLNLNDIGRLVLVRGNVIKKESSDFIISLSGHDQITIRGELGFPRRKLKLGDEIIATGILSVYRNRVRILLLGSENVKISSPKRLPESGSNLVLQFNFFISIIFSLVWYIRQKTRVKLKS